ncbi:MAG: DUF1800 domain-containing protein [Isosphaeraceae bacterium]
MTPTTLRNDPERAWSRYSPGPDTPWDLARVAHLHRRAGFAAPWAILQRDLRDGPDASIDRLMEGEATSADGKDAAAFESLADEMARQLASEAALPRLQGLWLYRMIFTGRPLRERMTLFWHGHFATSQTKVQNTGLMQRQNDLFRTHALGKFPRLLSAIGKDPAMLIWLDSTANRKAHPNENYAREVMELFTLGRGHYTEKDVQEAARAFTGWFVQRDRFQEIAAQHDSGTKTVLGQTGAFRGDDIPAILLAQASSAEFLCGKLARQFLDEVDPLPPALIAPLARSFRESGYEIRVPLETILRSTLFHAREVRRRRVKNPVEFAVGTVRALEILKPTVQVDALAEACGRMGQSLYAPPSVAGWDGGPAWGNSTAMLTRTNLALALVSTEDAALGARFDPAALAARHGFHDAGGAARFYSDLLVQDAFDRTVRASIEAASLKAAGTADAAREVATLILSSPEYQLA